jgi:Di-haem oxidoreductase, putative peroxidase
MSRGPFRVLTILWLGLIVCGATVSTQSPAIGRELAVPRHLQDGEEFALSARALVEHGRRLFTAVWTIQEGGGRPLTKGTGDPLDDATSPLVFPRNFNRISAPDANSCAGCHNLPFGIPGGGGDIVANVFVLGQRFDFATFDSSDVTPTRGEMNEAGQLSQLQTIANSRATLGLFGSGYIEMLARQITEDLQSIRNATPPGGFRRLVSKGVSFGTMARTADGRWITSGVQGIAAPSLVTSGAADPPSLIIRPFHQAGNVVSIRQFSNNAFNHHHGIQSTERFGIGTDPDGDGFVNEMTRADVTAVSIFQATMAVPGRVIPNDPDIEAAVLLGEQRFSSIGCAICHLPELPLDRHGWMFSEPNPFNPTSPHNLLIGEAPPTLTVDLSRDDLPSPRLKPRHGVVMVPAYTDLKLHDITTGLPGDPNIEALDMNQPAGSPAFFAGNRKFLTRKLWGTANEPPFFHHGMFTTLRQAVLAHAGEAAAAGAAFRALPSYEQDCVIEFLKSLQVLPPGTKHLVIDERGDPREWPPRRGER